MYIGTAFSLRLLIELLLQPFILVGANGAMRLRSRVFHLSLLPEYVLYLELLLQSGDDSTEDFVLLVEQPVGTKRRRRRTHDETGR